MREEWPLLRGGYELQGEVGSSKHGVVRRAWCPAREAEVAIKIVNLDTLVGEGEVDRLHAQTTLLSGMSDHHVIRYHCSFVYRQELWIVMEYAAHGSARLVMTGDDGTVRPLAEGHIATILSAVTRGIAYLHARERAHRDIKAANILVHASGRATLGDFASSRSLFATGDRKELQTFVGTPHWMAPEVLEQSGRYGLQADIWSLGITAIELATGAVPLEGEPPLKVMRERLDPAAEVPSLPPGESFSADFREFVSMCLQRDPSARPTAAKLLEHPYFRRATSAAEIVDDVLCRLAPLEKRHAATSSRAIATAQSRTEPDTASQSREFAEQHQHQQQEQRQERVKFSFSFGDDSDEDVGAAATETEAAPGMPGAPETPTAQKVVQFGECSENKYGSSSDLLSFAEEVESSNTSSCAVEQVFIPDSNGVVNSAAAVLPTSNATTPGRPQTILGTNAAAAAAAATGTAHAAHGPDVIVGIAESTSTARADSACDLAPAGSASADTTDLIEFDSPKEPVASSSNAFTAAPVAPRPAGENRFSVTPLEESIDDRGAAVAPIVTVTETVPGTPNRMGHVPALVPTPAQVPLTPSSRSNSVARSSGVESGTTSTGTANAMSRHSSTGSTGSSVDVRQKHSSAAVSPATSPPSQDHPSGDAATQQQQQKLVKSGSRFSMSSITPTTSLDGESLAFAGGASDATPSQGREAARGLPRDEVPLAVVDEPTLMSLLRQLQRRVSLSANGHSSVAGSAVVPTEQVLESVDLAAKLIKDASILMERTRPRG